MNVVWYVGKFDEATWALFARIGLTSQFLRDNGRGMVAVEQQISYKQELLAGDCLSITSEFLEVREKSVRFRHVMRRDADNAVAAETILTGVHIDTVLRKACALPADVRQLAEGLVA